MPRPTTDQLYSSGQDDTGAQVKITRHLVMLHNASYNIFATLDSQKVVELIVQEFSNLLSAQACLLGVWNEEETRLDIVAEHQANSQSKTQSILNAYPLLIKPILSRRNVLHITVNTPGADKDLTRTMKECGITSLLLLPLIINNQPIGLVEVLNNSEITYETYVIIIARLFANQAAISIENARLYKNAKQEILARQNAEEKLKYTALHDALTNLPNRLLFLDRLEHAISRFKRFENLEFAVLFVDLDGFKRINDSFGHIEGDRALYEISQRLLDSTREVDTVCRFGGDEFLVLLEGELHSAFIKEVTDRIQHKLGHSMLIEGYEFHVTASIGIAFCNREISDANEYIRNANIAMYQAKAKGGGKVEIFTQTKALAVRSKAILESEIREATRSKSFDLYYQPIYNLDTLSIVGVEALLRWKGKETTISPTRFVPVIERLGLMPELGLWILSTAIEKYQTWKKYNRGVSQLSLSVNISNIQLEQEDFVYQVTRILRESSMNPEKLNLEITEHVLINDLELAKRKIRALNDLGVKVHLDDFGTGYSSLTYLNDLPVQALKIDRKFVQQINPTEMDKGLVSSILSMARKFNISVIAEGIEREGQLRGLRYAECRFGQGEFLSPAISEKQLLELLRTSPFLS